MPGKPSPLRAIRRQAAAHQRMTATAMVSSAYHKLSRSNEAFKYGRPLREDDEDDNEVIRRPAQKKVQKITRKEIRAKSKAPVNPPVLPAAPVTKNWRPAGGENSLQNTNKMNGELTDTLGIARLSTWRAETFIEALKVLIEQHGQIEEVQAEELLHGGESITDVFLKFRSELVAEAVKEKIDGELLESRKLQVTFA